MPKWVDVEKHCEVCGAPLLSTKSEHTRHHVLEDRAIYLATKGG
jgi:hypothetical protein